MGKGKKEGKGGDRGKGEESVGQGQGRRTCACMGIGLCQYLCWYRVILKKVSFGVYRTILVSKEEKNFTIKSKHKGLSLSKFS